MAKDSAINPKVERLEKIAKILLEDTARSGSITWASVDYHTSTSGDGIDSARDAISPFFLGCNNYHYYNLYCTISDQHQNNAIHRILHLMPAHLNTQHHLGKKNQFRLIYSPVVAA